jgi:hypothetical protein
MAANDQGKVEQERRVYKTGWEPIIGVLVVVAIVSFVLDGPRTNAFGRARPANEATLNNTAILGGIEKRITSSAFRGGDATAVMGGINIDLRDAAMEGSEATIDVSALMGGVTIRVPRKWKVVNRIVPVMGGVKDNTVSPGDGGPRLVLRGVVLMGGLDIRN